MLTPIFLISISVCNAAIVANSFCNIKHMVVAESTDGNATQLLVIDMQTTEVLDVLEFAISSHINILYCVPDLLQTYVMFCVTMSTTGYKCHFVTLTPQGHFVYDVLTTTFVTGEHNLANASASLVFSMIKSAYGYSVLSPVAPYSYEILFINRSSIYHLNIARMCYDDDKLANVIIELPLLCGPFPIIRRTLQSMDYQVYWGIAEGMLVVKVFRPNPLLTRAYICQYELILLNRIFDDIFTKCQTTSFQAASECSVKTCKTMTYWASMPASRPIFWCYGDGIAGENNITADTCSVANGKNVYLLHLEATPPQSYETVWQVFNGMFTIKQSIVWVICAPFIVLALEHVISGLQAMWQQ